MKNFFTGLFLLVILIVVISSSNLVPGLTGQFKSAVNFAPAISISQDQILAPALMNKLMSGTQAFWQLALKLVDYLRSGQWRETTGKTAGIKTIFIEQAGKTPDYLKQDLSDFSKFLEQHGTASTTKGK